MGLNLFPQFIQENYEIHQWKHACAILKNDFPSEWMDIIDMLMEFRLQKKWILTPGGRKSSVSEWLDHFLFQRGWVEKGFDTKLTIDNTTMNAPTHKVDCFKNRIALEIEWNNKDPFFDRDLNNFRLLFDLRVISVGIIITRSDELQDVFNACGRGSSYGASTTHLSKLLPRIEGGGVQGVLFLFLASRNLFW
jgi:hypothetical protein